MQSGNSEVGRWRGHFHRVKGWVVAAAGLGAILSGLVGYYTTYKTVAAAAPPPRPGANALPTTTALSIIVLPFANQTGDEKKGYVADALTATITTGLSRVSGAYVVPTSTAAAFQDRKLTVQQLGAEARVRFVLQGSVLSSGQKVRLTTQLSDSHSGAIVWNGTLDGEVTNLFALQDKVTTSIGNSIQREMIVRAARDSETRTTTPAVADLTLRALALQLKPRSVENFARREALLRQALAVEPDNVILMGSLAGTLATDADNFGAVIGDAQREAKFAESRELAIRGITLDPDQSSFHAALAMYAGAHDDPAGAMREAERNLALNSTSPQAHNLLASVLLESGDPSRALELLNQAVTLDPLHISELVWMNQGLAFMQLGEYDRSIEALHKSLERNPSLLLSQLYLVLAHSLKGDDAKARSLASELSPAARAITLQQLTGIDSKAPKTSSSASAQFGTKLVAAWRKAGLRE